MPILCLIYARAANGVIGRNNALPWHLPQDIAHFRQRTQGCSVIMGRKTWDSLAPRFRPLPGRSNIVLTRQNDWQADGARRAASLEQALALCPPRQLAWVIGGAQIYAQALPLAERVEATEIAQDFDGDAHAPVLQPGEWRVRQCREQRSDCGLQLRFVSYERVRT